MYLWTRVQSFRNYVHKVGEVSTTKSKLIYRIIPDHEKQKEIRVNTRNLCVSGGGTTILFHSFRYLSIQGHHSIKFNKFPIPTPINKKYTTEHALFLFIWRILAVREYLCNVQSSFVKSQVSHRFSVLLLSKLLDNFFQLLLLPFEWIALNILLESQCKFLPIFDL